MPGRLFSRASVLSAWFCVAIGAGVATLRLLQLPASAVSLEAGRMTTDAALCFVLSGLALAAARTGRRAIAGWTAGFMLAAIIVVHLLGLWRPAPPSGPSWPLLGPAMSFQLALCFIGTSVAILGYVRQARASLAAALSSLAAAWGTMSMLGYSVDLGLLYGWSGVKPMAFLSALTLAVLSGGLLCVAVRDSLEQAPNMLPDWLHVPVGVFTGAGGLILWHATTGRLIEREVLPIEAASDAMFMVASGAAALMAAVVRLWVVAHRRQVQLEQMHLELRRSNEDLRRAAAQIKTLSGLIPICAWCKSIRSDEGYWQQLEHYLVSHADVMFTHGICPGCVDHELAPKAAASLEASAAPPAAAHATPGATGTPAARRTRVTSAGPRARTPGAPARRPVERRVARNRKPPVPGADLAPAGAAAT